MQIQEQVISYNKACMLKGFGIAQKSLFYHHPAFDRPVFGETVTTEWGKQYKKTQVCNDKKAAQSAFTISELSKIFGKGTNEASLLYDAVQDQMNRSHSFTIAYSLDFLCNCLINLLQTGRITAEECNKRLAEK